MVDDKIKIKYFQEVLEKGIRKIYESQRGIAGAKLAATKKENRIPSGRSGALMAALNAAGHTINSDNYGVHAELQWPIYIRFLDMKRLGNWKIYNRQLWGILYKDTFVEMRYGFRDWLQNYLTRSLTESLKPLNTGSK